MPPVRPLPPSLVARYQGWKATGYAENKTWYKRLASEGQHPRALIISCCDSRVHVTSIFGADEGEFFIHRNIANMVPPYAPDGQLHGTSAAIEYAVTALKVANIIVLGHSTCGGVRGFYEMATGNAPELADGSSFVGNWIKILQPGYDRIKDSCSGDECVAALEKEAVKVSLDNLMTFPFVAEAVAREALTLHGLWNDIGEGALWWYDPESDGFKPV